MLNWGHYLENIEFYIFLAFIFFFLIQVYYYLRYYYPVLFYKNKNGVSDQPVSVIICARNEGESLRKNLPLFLKQNYREFEVIVVNDCSTDNTDEVLGEFLASHKNFRTTTIQSDRKFHHGKKLALTVGIKAANYENLIFTDADCIPVSDNWLTLMSSGFVKKDIVLGYGGFLRKKSILNNYIRFESVFIAFNYLGFALAKKPYMGVGRNLGYKKNIFFKNKGFASNYGIISGDDDLFINEVATSENTAIVLEPDSFTRSEAKVSWSEYFNQKLRHLSTFNNYKPIHIFMLGLESISRIWFYVLFLILVLMQANWLHVLLLFSFRFMVQLFLFLKVQQKFKERNLGLTFYIFDIYSMFFNFIVYLTLTLRRRKIRWK